MSVNDPMMESKHHLPECTLPKDLATFSGATKMEAWDAYSKGGAALGTPMLTDADLTSGEGSR